MAFIKHTANPNAPVGGGCIGMGGQKGYDCRAPFFEATGVVGLNATCPKIVICGSCLGELNRAADREPIPVGYATSEAQAAERALVEHADRVEPEPAAKPKRKPRTSKPADGELSL